MKKHRINELRDNKKLTFSRAQAYLILGCILAIAVLAFSLGHLMTRENKESAVPVSDHVANPAISEAEVQKEMEKIEKRLDKAEGSPSIEIPEEESGAKEESVQIEVVEFKKPDKSETKEPEKPVQKKAPIKEGITSIEPVKVKKIKPVKRTIIGAPIAKKVDVKAKKPPKTAAAPAVPASKPAAKKEENVKTVKVQQAPIPPSLPPQEEVKEAVPDEPKPFVLTKPPSMLNPKYTVQVASVISSGDAKLLKESLQRKGYRAYIKKSVRSRVIWHRVRVGAFDQRGDAEKLARELKDNEALKAIVMSYEKP